MSWVSRLRGHIQQEAQRATAHMTLPRIGIVQNYDPARYAARVTLQPENIMTGWLPITSPWVGNGFGFFAPPNIGDVVEVQFQQGGREAGFIVGRFYSTKTVPIPVQSGEILIQHQSGSFFHMTNAGDLILHAARNYAFDANGQGQRFNGSNVETWQDNDSPGAPHHNHAPPKIPV